MQSLARLPCPAEGRLWITPKAGQKGCAAFSRFLLSVLDGGMHQVQKKSRNSELLQKYIGSGHTKAFCLC